MVINHIARMLSFAFIIMVNGVLAAQVDQDAQAVAIFRQRCVSCHGKEEQESDLRLDQASGLIRGGVGGPVVIAGSSEESELLRRVTSSEADDWMPPDGERLTAEQVQLLKFWIDAGAHWPADSGTEPVWNDDRLEHWAWQPIRAVQPPDLVTAGRWSQSEIDRFVLARLREQSLDHAPPADAPR
jgi:cytochrome c2